MFCSQCGTENNAEARFCQKCGQQIYDGAPIGRQGVAALASIPEGVKGWSWGAFTLNWIWGPFNGTWIALLALIPLVGFVMSIVLGVKGREWAWKNKKWDSLDHFNRVQRGWSAWGVALYIVSIVIGILASLALPAYQGYVKRTQAANEAARIALAAAPASTMVLKPFYGELDKQAAAQSNPFLAADAAAAVNSVGDVNSPNSIAIAELKKIAVAGTVRVSQQEAQESLKALPELQGWASYIDKHSGGKSHGKVMAWTPASEIVNGLKYWSFQFMQVNEEMDHRWESFLVSTTSGEILVDDMMDNKLLTLDQWRSQQHPLDRIKE